MMFRSTNLTHLPVFEEYVRGISNGFCPFIYPAQQKNILFFSEYNVEMLNSEKVEAAIFYIGLAHAEILRKERRRQKTRVTHDFMCENAIFFFPSRIDRSGEAIFVWPHWILKVLYTKFSLLFGKFWKGEESSTRDGRKIPPPPNHFLSVRSAIKPTDAKFFLKAPQLTQEHIESCDDWSSVFSQVSVSIPDCVREAELIIGDKIFISLIGEMLATNFYERMKKLEMTKFNK